MIDWILDAKLQRRAQIGLNKGECPSGAETGYQLPSGLLPI